MYPGNHAVARAGQPAVIMANSGEVITYGELEARSNRLAHLFRARGLRRLDHYAIFMENNARYVEACAAGTRAGLYYTCVNSFLTPEELAYIINNCEAKILITSEANRAVAAVALLNCPNIELCLIVDGEGDGDRVQNLDAATAPYPSTPIADETLGIAMLYSSGTTGRPKGILRPLPEQPPVQALQLYVSWTLWRYRDGMIYLSPAPLYHSAPQAAVSLTIRSGGTAIIMETFEPEHYLQLVENYRVTHSPACADHVLAHAEAAGSGPQTIRPVLARDRGPCRRALPGAGEGTDDRVVGTDHPGILRHDRRPSVSPPATAPSGWRIAAPSANVLFGGLHVLDADMQSVPGRNARHAVVQHRLGVRIFQRSRATKEARSPDGTMSTVGDVGYLDEDGYLYLTDRATFMIISGGVNIYPQECENLLITHPKVADAAVFGVPNEDLGEEVKAAVQLMPASSLDRR